MCDCSPKLSFIVVKKRIQARFFAQSQRGGGLDNPMPGTVVEVIATIGTDVQAGELLMTIESMKLQTAITAPHDCRVAELPLAAGATFDQGDVLIRLETPEDGEE